jgi:hypothetical protein
VLFIGLAFRRGILLHHIVAVSAELNVRLARSR